MVGHKIGFDGEIRLIIPKLSLLPLLIWSTAEPFQKVSVLKGKNLLLGDYLLGHQLLSFSS